MFWIAGRSINFLPEDQWLFSFSINQTSRCEIHQQLVAAIVIFFRRKCLAGMTWAVIHARNQKATKTVFFLIVEDDQEHSLNSPTRDVGRLGLEVLTSTEA